MSIPSRIAKTPPPPYYAVIFTSVRTEGDSGYGEMAERMALMVSRQPGFLGMESARAEAGITLCYWKDMESIENWRKVEEHELAQRFGRERWYSHFAVRIAKVERAYGFEKTADGSFGVEGMQ